MWGQAFFIILIFVVLAANIATSIGIKNIQENWNEYRCNPLIMPLAGSISPDGKSSAQNFSSCVQDFMMEAAPALTQPLSYVQDMTISLLSSMQDSNEAQMQQSSSFSFSVSSLMTSVYNVMIGMVGEFNILIVKMMDAQGKIMGAMTAMMYIMTTVNYTFLSMWNGIPGKLINSFSKMTVSSNKKK
jgi:hypothetical protein